MLVPGSGPLVLMTVPGSGRVVAHFLHQASNFTGNALQALLGLEDGGVDVLHPLQQGVGGAVLLCNNTQFKIFHSRFTGQDLLLRTPSSGLFTLES
jgi:hypothetical protein